MKFKMNNKFVRWGVTAFMVIASSICFYYIIFHGTNIKTGLKNITEILMPVVFGFVISYLLTPVLNFVEYRILIPFFNFIKVKETKGRIAVIRGMGIIITVFLFIMLVYVLCSMMLSQIIPSIMNIVDNFDAYISNFTKWINRLLEDNPEMQNYVVHLIDRYSGELESWLNETFFTKTSELIKTVSLSVIGVLMVLWDFIIGFVIAIYVLVSKEKFTGQAKKIIYALFKQDTANIIINNFRFTHKTFIGFISGKVLDSILIGLLCFIGTTLLNTPYAALVSVIVGVTNVIPFFGPYLGAIPSIILIFIVDPTHPLNCLYFAIFILALQQFDGNVLGPKILGDSTGLAGFWVIFSITVMGGLFGVPGMIIGVPVFAVLFAAIRSVIEALLKKKQLPIESQKYINVCMVDDNGLHEYIPEYKLKKEQRGKNPYGAKFLSNYEDDELLNIYLTEEKNEKEDNNEEIESL